MTPFVMLTDSTCALCTREQYTYGSAAKACLRAVCFGPLNGVPGKFALAVISQENTKYLQGLALN